MTSDDDGQAARPGIPVPPDLPARLAADPACAAWLAGNCPDVDHRRELARFMGYWAAGPGQGAVKDDWADAWQVWMRQAQWRAGRPARRARAAAPGPDPVPRAYAAHLRPMTAQDALLALLAGTPPPPSTTAGAPHE